MCFIAKLIFIIDYVVEIGQIQSRMHRSSGRIVKFNFFPKSRILRQKFKIYLS